MLLPANLNFGRTTGVRKRSLKPRRARLRDALAQGHDGRAQRDIRTRLDRAALLVWRRQILSGLLGEGRKRRCDFGVDLRFHRRHTLRFHLPLRELQDLSIHGRRVMCRMERGPGEPRPTRRLPRVNRVQQAEQIALAEIVVRVRRVGEKAVAHRVERGLLLGGKTREIGLAVAHSMGRGIHGLAEPGLDLRQRLLALCLVRLPVALQCLALAAVQRRLLGGVVGRLADGEIECIEAARHPGHVLKQLLHHFAGRFVGHSGAGCHRARGRAGFVVGFVVGPVRAERGLRQRYPMTQRVSGQRVSKLGGFGDIASGNLGQAARDHFYRGRIGQRALGLDIVTGQLLGDLLEFLDQRAAGRRQLSEVETGRARGNGQGVGRAQLSQGIDCLQLYPGLLPDLRRFGDFPFFSLAGDFLPFARGLRLVDFSAFPFDLLPFQSQSALYFFELLANVAQLVFDGLDPGRAPVRLLRHRSLERLHPSDFVVEVVVVFVSGIELYFVAGVRDMLLRLLELFLEHAETIRPRAGCFIRRSRLSFRTLDLRDGFLERGHLFIGILEVPGCGCQLCPPHCHLIAQSRRDRADCPDISGHTLLQQLDLLLDSADSPKHDIRGQYPARRGRAPRIGEAHRAARTASAQLAPFLVQLRFLLAYALMRVGHGPLQSGQGVRRVGRAAAGGFTRLRTSVRLRFLRFLEIRLCLRVRTLRFLVRLPPPHRRHSRRPRTSLAARRAYPFPFPAVF